MTYIIEGLGYVGYWQVVLHLRKVNQEACNGDSGMYSHTVSSNWYHLSHTHAHGYI